MVNIKLDQFEGPFALLVQLIEKAELDITQVSLATVADQYILELKKMTYLDPDALADFLVVASRLLLIKAKALLPYLLPEEEEAITDFEEQLRMYKEFLEATKKIEKMVAGKKFMFVREYNRKSLAANLKLFTPPKKLTADGLKIIFLSIVEQIKPVVTPLIEETLAAKINIEDRISFIARSITKLIKSRFSELISDTTSKVEVVVSFLAMLELIKQRTITADQGDIFGEIEIISLS